MLAREGKEQWEGCVLVLQGQHRGSGASRALSSHKAPVGVRDHKVLLPSGSAPGWDVLRDVELLGPAWHL